MANPTSRDDDTLIAGSTSAGSTIGGSTTGGSTTTGTSTLGTSSTSGTQALDETRGGVSSRAAGGTTQRGARIVGDQSSEHGGPGPRLMTADTLIGNQVVNHQGDTLGEIEDIMLDVPNGRVAYAVMAAGGFLGMGEKLFALPWGALALDTTRKCFILDADKQRIQNAPGFDKDHWPSQADLQWQQDVHSYYQARPYWDESL